MRWRRNTRSGASCHTMAHPDYGDAGIYREGHRASSKAKPRRDATFVPRSSERLICRCRGQIGPESDGAAPASTRSHKASGHPGLAGDGPAMPSAQPAIRTPSGTVIIPHPTHRALGYELGTSDFSWPPPPGFTAPTMTNTPIRTRSAIASTSCGSHGCCRSWSHREVESCGPTDEAAT
jgi:hypothetical protein